MSSDRGIVSIWTFSDGVSRSIPPAARCLVADNAYLKRRIGKKLAEERHNYQTSGHYTVDRLPYGYTCWRKGRTVHAHLHTDRYIYGHPSGGCFNSFNKAWQHFKQLEDTSSNVLCECVLCKRGGFAKSSLPISTKLPSPTLKPANTTPVFKSNAESQSAKVTPSISTMSNPPQPHMSRLRNPYDILGLWHTATTEEVDSAWRNILSMLPDVLDEETCEEKRRADNARHLLTTDKMRKFVDQCIACKEHGLKKELPWVPLRLKPDATKKQILAAYEEFRVLWAEYETAALVVFDVVRDARDLLLGRL